MDGRGLKLLDVVVAIGVAALMLVIALPAISKSRADANLAKCEANLHAIATGFAAYAGNNDDLMPQTETFNMEGWKAGGNNLALLTWCEALVIDGAVKMETNRNGALNKQETWQFPACGRGIFECPSHDAAVQNGMGDGVVARGYGMAWCATSNFRMGIMSRSMQRKDPPVLVRTAKLVPRHIIAADGFNQMGSAGASAMRPGDGRFARYGVYERHVVDGLRGANYLFADYHVEWSDTYVNVPSPTVYGGKNPKAVPPIWVHP